MEWLVPGSTDTVIISECWVDTREVQVKCGGGGIMLLKCWHQNDVSVVKAERVCIQGILFGLKFGHLYSWLAISIQGWPFVIKVGNLYSRPNFIFDFAFIKKND